jgi:hypothetical protein
MPGERRKPTCLPYATVLSNICTKPEPFQFIQALSGHNSSMTTTIDTHLTPGVTERIISPLDRIVGERNLKTAIHKTLKSDKFIWIFTSYASC